MQLSEYIDDLGVDKISELYNVSTVTSRSWRDMKSAPAPEKAAEIIEKTHDLVTWADIYAPYFAKLKTAKAA